MGSAACAYAGSHAEQQQHLLLSASPELRDSGTATGEINAAAGASRNLPGDCEFPSTGTRGLAEPGATESGSEARRTSGTAVLHGEAGSGERAARDRATIRPLEPLSAVHRTVVWHTPRATGEDHASAGLGASVGGASSRLWSERNPSREGGLPDLRERRTSRMVGSVQCVRLPPVLGLVACGEHPWTAARFADSAAGVRPRGPAGSVAGAGRPMAPKFGHPRAVGTPEPRKGRAQGEGRAWRRRFPRKGSTGIGLPRGLSARRG